ncbi:hypothetical protein AAL_06467 [Moelleriella libera RCEF 2490]|uniref:HET-s/LopB domain protein n=1 Tax=Moelleriella libera RCEF 2490 TaxID=1081109 RepID=A0A162ID41_9HYPO|nr:hypothetical protein AAL_06467 [Moelleriella libera RCEF 2490]
MASLLSAGGFQLPLKRGLSRLYNDTKKSSDFVNKEQARHENSPEVKALHRKLRIQKNRLVSWGLEWSDSSQPAEISDESLDKAGLSDVVGNIMSMIKEILAEAEPLWQSSMHVSSGKPSLDRKTPLMQWDQGRFEDLVKDLTASIDTLYDLSRTRSGGIWPRLMSRDVQKITGTEDFRPFEPSRMQTPLVIDPSILIRPQSMENGGTSAPLREIVYLSKTAYSDLARGMDLKEPWGPLLLEYAPFDTIFSTTGIMPPMSRFEKLSSGLQQDSQRASWAWSGLPQLLAYFEDMDNSRIGLVYRFPPSFYTASLERTTADLQFSLPTLHDLLNDRDEPPLEVKYRLAYNLTNTVFDMHARGVTHGNLQDKNVSFRDFTTTKDGGAEESTLGVRRPLLSSFDLFPRDDSETSPSPWRHVLDSHTSNSMSSHDQTADGRVLEMYSLAMLLLSIGLWSKLETFLPDLKSTAVTGSALDRLGIRCGTLYVKAVQTCWQAAESELNSRPGGQGSLSEAQMRTSKFLETCCILDGVSGLEQSLAEELRDLTSSRQCLQTSIDAAAPPIQYVDEKPPSFQALSSLPWLKPGLGENESGNKPASQLCPRSEGGLGDVPSAGKMRLYPHVPLPPDAVSKWNTTLMPQINHALRHFYQKHPESVEISLESVGPSVTATQPTVVVICTSVGKVRAILKKRLGELFIEGTGFPLRVCHGNVVRSRRFQKSISRSMAPSTTANARSDGCDDGQEEEVEAANIHFQQRPEGGASIGAWIGTRHLPPVSFGGLVLINEKPYGMTVHHMLDDPDHESSQEDSREASPSPETEKWTEFSGGWEDFDCTSVVSDTESEAYSETEITSDYESDEEERYTAEPGDIEGVDVGYGDGYYITQPALDDIEEGFYPSLEDRDDDHLCSFTLGELYASSGIRRKNVSGLLHEVDWALFEFGRERLPEDNAMRAAECGMTSGHGTNPGIVRPTSVAPLSSLPGTRVQCLARTSGLRTGCILPTLTSVKMFGRHSPSHTYQVASNPSDGGEGTSNSPIGLPGDSGAWVIDRDSGRVCGHVLAWSHRKRVAYICPMEVLMHDMAEAVDAIEVRLPGGEVVVFRGDSDQGEDQPEMSRLHPPESPGAQSADRPISNDMEMPETDEDHRRARAERRQSGVSDFSPPLFSRGMSVQGCPTPLRIEPSRELRGLAGRFEDLNVGRTKRIGVN